MRRHRSLSGAALALVAGGCISTLPPAVTDEAPRGSPGTPTSAPTPRVPPSVNWSILPLEPTSRRLLAVLEPGEEVSADIRSPDADFLARSAPGVGLTAHLGRDGLVALRGDVTAIGSLLDPGLVQSVELYEDESVLRFIPDARPDVDVPVPGAPYVGFGLPGDLIRFPAPVAAREGLVRDLAMRVRTVDGQPYEVVQVSGGCEGEGREAICHATLIGLPIGAVRESDYWFTAVTEQGATAPREESGAGTLTGVPRRWLRAAEWLARHDLAALKRIATYTTCCGSWWDPAAPGRITLWYTRDCTLSVAPVGARVADTGDCVDGLEIAVDLASGAVTRIEEHAGP